MRKPAIGNCVQVFTPDALLSDGPNDAACGSCVVRGQLILLVDHLVVFGKRR
jgi:hypothetical protein